MGDCLIEIQMTGLHPWTLTKPKQEVGLNQELSEVCSISRRDLQIEGAGGKKTQLPRALYCV